MEGESTADGNKAVAGMSLESKGQWDQHQGYLEHKVKFIDKAWIKWLGKYLLPAEENIGVQFYHFEQLKPRP